MPWLVPPDSGKTVNTFQHYANDFADDLLPIIRHDAVIHPDSPAFDSLMANRGKVPGRKFSGGWFGFPDWANYTADPAQFGKWTGWSAGVGLQGRNFPGLDIDVDDRALAEAIHKEALSMLGDAPCRFGREPRRLLVYSGGGLGKQRLAFIKRLAASSDDETGAGNDTRPVQAVEFLATGQYYVVEGIHPKTEQPYHWLDNQSPVQVGSTGLATVDAAAIKAFLDRVEQLLGLFGYEVAGRSRSAAGDRSVSQESLLAPSVAAVGRALAALPNDRCYDDWMKAGMAIKAACGPEHEAEALDLFMDWSLQWPENSPEQVEDKWSSMRPPFRVGWDYLAALATEEGDGSFYGAHEDFDAIEPTPSAEELASRADANPLTAMFRRSVWVQSLKRVCDINTGELFDREQFNVKNNHIGDPSSLKECAWATLMRDHKRLQRVVAVTYRPGEALFYDESLPDLVGICINRWRDPAPNLPSSVTDEDARKWLDHVAFVIPDERERGLVLDWLAWVIQKPAEKPNWCVVIGSTAEGIGKDLMMRPVRLALGDANVREIGPEDLVSDYTDYLVNTRLVIVEEMQLTERKAMQNKLKPLIAAPPETLRIREKYVPHYSIPNIIALAMFTNMDNALALSRLDRRNFVVWNDGPPRTADYYKELVAWYESGGTAIAARWLQLRDVSHFDAKGTAPMTAAKQAMRRASLPEADALIADAIQHRDPPFHRRFVPLAEVVKFLNADNDGARVKANAVGRKLRAAGALDLQRVNLGKPPAGVIPPHGFDERQTHLFALPGDMAALQLRHELEPMRQAFWTDWASGLDSEERGDCYERLFT